MNANSIKEFEKFHQINIQKNWKNGKKCLLHLNSLKTELEQTIVNLTDEDFEKYPSIMIIFQLTERVYEQIVGGICCISTNNHASSEILSRTAIEASVNITFMLIENTDDKVFSWFKKYIIEDSQHIDEWEKSLNPLSASEVETHMPRINARKKVNKIKAEFVQSFIDEVSKIMNIDKDYKWPKKMLKRFQEIGEEITYHTVYTRLSAQTHLNAEDTISYMIAKVYADEANQRNMGLETLAFSEFMLIYSIVFYAKIVGNFSQKYSKDHSNKIQEHIKELAKIMTGLAEKWKW